MTDDANTRGRVYLGGMVIVTACMLVLAGMYVAFQLSFIPFVLLIALVELGWLARRYGEMLRASKRRTCFWHAARSFVVIQDDREYRGEETIVVFPDADIEQAHQRFAVSWLCLTKNGSWFWLDIRLHGHVIERTAVTPLDMVMARHAVALHCPHKYRQFFAAPELA
ncbi:hypothetical protein KSF73_14260 [Burkholderiaceae bacterium DAT-1]|nr:hypothetical protein [Burkholderiaceae bacterium DAT-1]